MNFIGCSMEDMPVAVEKTKGEVEMKSSSDNKTNYRSGLLGTQFLAFVSMLALFLGSTTFAIDSKKFKKSQEPEFPPYAYVKKDGVWGWEQLKKAYPMVDQKAITAFFDGNGTAIESSKVERFFKDFTHDPSDLERSSKQNDFIGLARSYAKMIQAVQKKSKEDPSIKVTDTLKNIRDSIDKVANDSEKSKRVFGTHAYEQRTSARYEDDDGKGKGKESQGEAKFTRNVKGILAILDALGREDIIEKLAGANDEDSLLEILKEVFSQDEIMKLLDLKPNKPHDDKAGAKPTEKPIHKPENGSGDDSIANTEEKPPIPQESAKPGERTYYCVVPPQKKKDNSNDLADLLKALANKKMAETPDDDDMLKDAKDAAKDPEEQPSSPSGGGAPPSSGGGQPKGDESDSKPLQRDVPPQQQDQGMPFLGTGPQPSNFNETARIEPDEKLSTTGDDEVADFMAGLTKAKAANSAADKTLTSANNQPQVCATPGNMLMCLQSIGKIGAAISAANATAKDATTKANAARAQAAALKKEIKAKDANSAAFESAQENLAALKKNKDELQAYAQKLGQAGGMSKNPAVQGQIQMMAAQYNQQAQSVQGKIDTYTKNLAAAKKAYKSQEIASAEENVKKLEALAGEYETEAQTAQEKASALEDLKTQNQAAIQSMTQQRSQGNGDTTIGDLMGSSGGSGPRSNGNFPRGTAFGGAQGGSLGTPVIRGDLSGRSPVPSIRR